MSFIGKKGDIKRKITAILALTTISVFTFSCAIYIERDSERMLNFYNLLYCHVNSSHFI